MKEIFQPHGNIKVSIIIPAYNSDCFIGQSISSVIDQTYNNWELLVVDGGSKDNTREIVKKAANKDSRIRLINNLDDQGPAQARSFGIRFCKGDLVAFLDSDDLWLPSKLEKQICFMTNNNIKFSFTGYRLISEDGDISKAIFNGWKINTFTQYLRRRGIANSTVILNRECLSDNVLKSTGNSLAEDTLWWLLIMRSGYKAYCLQEPLMLYRKVAGSRSSMIFQNQMAVWSLYKNDLNLGLFPSIWYYLWYLLDVIIRRTKFKLSNKKG